MRETSPKRPTKRVLQNAVVTHAPLAPPEVSTAEIAEAFDYQEPALHGDDMDGVSEWLSEAEDNLLEEPTEMREEAVLAPVMDATEISRPAPRLVAPSGTLIAHCETQKITREELMLIQTPEATRTHQPIAHIRVVEMLEETLAFRHIHVVREEYAVSPDGNRMFGVLDLDYQYATLNSFHFSIGLRNSNDKTMRLGLTIGARVIVCDNMMFKGDFTPVLARHSRKLDLEETIALGVERMQRGFAPLRHQITGWQQQAVADQQVKLLIYEAFLERGLSVPRHLMPLVHKHYFEPQYAAFEPRTLWSLSNAFTSAFKELKPVRQFQVTAKLGEFMAIKTASLNDNCRATPLVEQEAIRVAHA